MNKLMYRAIFITFLLLICFCINACTPFAPTLKEHGYELAPQYYSLYGDEAEAYEPVAWWREFNDFELNFLIDEALNANLDIKQAWARMDQATARYRQAFGGLLPSVDMEGGYSATRQQSDVRAGASRTYLGNTENYSLGLFASYELDLWGRVNASVQSQRYGMAATQDDLYAMTESIAATVATYWVRIIAARQETAVLHKQLELNEKYLALVELRYANGMVTALDVFQQRQTVARTKTQIPLAQRNQQLLINDLKLLLGRPLNAPLQITRVQLPNLENLPQAGLPVDLLQNRPDVRAAGKRLYAAQWGVAQARANRLPAIKLTASGQVSSEDLTYLFTNWLASLAANLTAPIFDGGIRAAEVDYQRALAEENLNNYQKTVLNAINEVEAALLNEKAQREYLKNLEDEINAAQLALDEATYHYINGLDSYLPVLNQLADVQDLEITDINQKAELLVNRITLYRTLGGGVLTGEILNHTE